MDRERSQSILLIVWPIAFLVMCAAMLMSSLQATDDRAESDKWFKANMQCLDEFSEYARTGVIPARLRE